MGRNHFVFFCVCWNLNVKPDGFQLTLSTTRPQPWVCMRLGWWTCFSFLFLKLRTWLNWWCLRCISPFFVCGKVLDIIWSKFICHSVKFEFWRICIIEMYFALMVKLFTSKGIKLRTVEKNYYTGFI